MPAPSPLPPELLPYLADIQPPPAPPLPSWTNLGNSLGTGLLLLALGAAALFGLIAVMRRRRRSPARQALRRLRTLEREWRQGTCPPRQAAYRLATLLRLGLELDSLHVPRGERGHSDRKSLAHTDEWRALLSRLDELRYAPRPRQSLTPALFQAARRWLRTRSP